MATLCHYGRRGVLPQAQRDTAQENENMQYTQTAQPTAQSLHSKKCVWLGGESGVKNRKPQIKKIKP